MAALQVVLGLCAVLVLARAGPLGPLVAQEAEPFDSNPQYSYSYSIQDAVTGDSKGHSETRNGDVVQGQYSVVDADGTRRIVDYTADAVHGFNAVVRREGSPSAHAVAAPAPVAARALLPAAPAPYVQYSSPRFSYSVQPLAVASSAPVARYAPPPFAAAAPGHHHHHHHPITSGVHTSVSTPYHSYSY